MDRVIWIFKATFDSSLEISVLGSESARKFAALLENKEEWRVRCQNWSKFKDLKDCENELKWTKSISSYRASAPEELPKPKAAEVQKTTLEPERRQDPRVPMELEGEIRANNQTLPFKSIDLSLSGIKLDKALTDFSSDQPLEIVLFEPGQHSKILLPALKVLSSDNEGRLRFSHDQSPESRVRLGLFIERVIARRAHDIFLKAEKKAA